MKALQYQDIHQVGLADVPEPELQAGEALIEIDYAGICGTDMAIWAGKHPRAKAPLTLGHEISGRIVSLQDPPGSSTLKEGSFVTINPLISCGNCWSCREGLEHICYQLRLFGIDAPGGMANYLKVPLSNVHALPAGLDPAKAALTEPLAVGIHAVNLGNPNAHDKVLVIGAGPIGLINALCLRRKGVSHLLISDVCDYRLELARKLGFETVDGRTVDLKKHIHEWTEGVGVDAVYEVSGHPSAMDGITDLVRCRGLIMMVRVHKDACPVDLRSINFKEITILGSRCYQDTEFAEAIEALPDLPAEALISHRMPLAEGPEGFQAMLDPNLSCKVLFEAHS